MGEIARALAIQGGIKSLTAKRMADAVNEILNVAMDDAADVSGSVTTQTVGFQITNWKGKAYKSEVVIHLGVFRDIDKGIPASGVGTPDGVIATAVEGSFLDPTTEGTAGAAIKTNTNGRFSCTLTLTSPGFPQTLYVGCVPGSGPIIDCRSVDSVTFSS